MENQASSMIKGIHLDTLHPSVSFGLSIAQMELVGGLPENGNYSVTLLCTGDPDDLLPVLRQLNGEKVAKIKVGLYEPIRDGMLVNLFFGIYTGSFHSIRRQSRVVTR
jgi:O-succinylbenzoate synthase